MRKNFTDTLFRCLSGLVSKPLGKHCTPPPQKFDPLKGDGYVRMLEEHHEKTTATYMKLMTWIVFLLGLAIILMIMQEIQAIKFLTGIPAIAIFLVGIFLVCILWNEITRMSFLSMLKVENRAKHLKSETTRLKLMLNTAKKLINSDLDPKNQIDETRWDIKYCMNCRNPIEMTATVCNACKSKQKSLLPN